jgi:hypothetical protein
MRWQPYGGVDCVNDFEGKGKKNHPSSPSPSLLPSGRTNSCHLYLCLEQGRLWQHQMVVVLSGGVVIVAVVGDTVHIYKQISCHRVIIYWHMTCANMHKWDQGI